jgi:catechol 2,3-dioxygenase-like lactoylglutathione lyase family enzyme
VCHSTLLALRENTGMVLVRAIAALILAGSLVGAQTKGLVIDSGAFTVFVENLDRSLAFYRDVLDMDVQQRSARVAGIRTTVEVREIQQVEPKTAQLRIQDPGNATLVLMVRNVDATLARVTKAGYPVVTAGGTPVALDDGTRAVVVRDVDNRFIELRQPPSIPASAPAHNIVDIHVMLTVADLPRTTQVYRDVFGFTVEGERTAFVPDRPTQLLSGLKDAKARWARARARDSQMWLEFIEFNGVDRRPLDRGATRLQLRTQGIEAVVEAARRAGLRIDTQGGKEPLIADPNNFLVSLFESVQ